MKLKTGAALAAAALLAGMVAGRVPDAPPDDHEPRCWTRRALDGTTTSHADACQWLAPTRTVLTVHLNHSPLTAEQRRAYHRKRRP